MASTPEGGLQKGDKVRVRKEQRTYEPPITYIFLRLDKENPGWCWVWNADADREWVFEVSDLEFVERPKK